jgi:hypothetical protein
MAGNVLAQSIVEGDDTWRLFSPFEVVWAGGRLGRAAMQVYYWWFDARERFEARAARQREEEYRRAGELAALRAGEDQVHGEARLGAVVPREQLPEEPALEELPADPIPPGEVASPPLDHTEPADDRVDEPADVGPRFARTRLPDASVVERDADDQRDGMDARARPKRTM